MAQTQEEKSRVFYHSTFQQNNEKAVSVNRYSLEITASRCIVFSILEEYFQDSHLEISKL
jgi:hypothetical protein